VSERSVIRIWAEAKRDDESEEYSRDVAGIAEAVRKGEHWHGSLPETVQAETINQLEHLKDQRAYYMAMQSAYPTNCAWGNLVLRYDQLIDDMLKVKGNWYGLERQREPLTYIGLKNNDLHEMDESAFMRDALKAVAEYKQANNIDDDSMTLRDTVKAILHARME